MFPAALPLPRTPDPMTAPTLRWGILGVSPVVERFALAVRKHTEQKFMAVAADDPHAAAELADQLWIPTAYATPDELVTASDIDVIFVATPFPHRHEHALAALAGGKHVLVQPPVGLSEASAAALSRAATERGLFAAEATWSLFLPKFDVIRQILDADLLGRVHTVLGDIGSPSPALRRDDGNAPSAPIMRLSESLLTLATWVVGFDFAGISAQSVNDESGIPTQIAASLRTPDSRMAAMFATTLARTPSSLSIVGSEATLYMDSRFDRPGAFSVVHDRDHMLHWDEPLRAEAGILGSEGLCFQAAEAARQIVAGQTSTPIRSMADTVATMRTMDHIRAACGLNDDL